MCFYLLDSFSIYLVLPELWSFLLQSYMIIFYRNNYSVISKLISRKLKRLRKIQYRKLSNYSAEKIFYWLISFIYYPSLIDGEMDRKMLFVPRYLCELNTWWIQEPNTQSVCSLWVSGIQIFKSLFVASQSTH